MTIKFPKVLQYHFLKSSPESFEENLGILPVCYKPDIFSSCRLPGNNFLHHQEYLGDDGVLTFKKYVGEFQLFKQNRMLISYIQASNNHHET